MREKLVNSLIVSLIAAVIACGWCGYEIGKTANALTVTVRDADSAVKESQQRIKDTSQNLNAALLQIGLMTDEARRASIEQRQYWNKVSAETVGAVRDARALIKASTEGVDQTTRDLHGTIVATKDDLVALKPVLQSLDSTVRDVDKNFAANQDLTRALKDFADASENINRTTANVAETSQDVRDRVHALTHPKPQRWFVAIGKALLDVSYKVKAFF